MNVGRWILAATMLASVSTVSVAQGRGGALPRRGDAMTEQQRQSLRELRQKHQKEMSELRTRHREQIERALPPAARQQLQERRRELMREGRMFERRQMLRERAGSMQRREIGPRRGGMEFRRGPQFGPRGRGGMLPPDSGGFRGRGRDGR